MSNNNLFVCPHCGRDDFRRERGLKQHLNTNTFCSRLAAEPEAFVQPNQQNVQATASKNDVQVQSDLHDLGSASDMLDISFMSATSINEANQHDSVQDAANTDDDEDISLDIALLDLDTDHEDEHEKSTVDDGGFDASNVYLEQFREYCRHSSENNDELDPHERAAIQLMDTLRKKRATLDTYDAVMEWHFRETGRITEEETLGDAYGYISRKSLIKKLAKRYNFIHKQLYQKRQVILPSSKAKVNIVWNDARELVVSLLTDPRFTDEDFLHFDNDPLAPPPEHLDYIADINTGTAYIETYRKLIKKPRKQMLVPIIMYIDGAVTGQFDKLQVEALKMTLGIFKRTTRDKEHAWRTLGYVPNYNKSTSRGKKLFVESGHVAAEMMVVDDEEGGEEENDEDASGSDSDDSSNDGEGKVVHSSQDYHKMLSELLRSYRDLEQEGMIWDYKYTGNIYKGLELVFFLAFIKCDGDGADKLAGKYQARGKNVAHLCRYCMCPREETDSHSAKYKYKTEPMINKLVEANNGRKLQSISQQNLKNAFYGLRFGLQNDRGIHGATPVELLHAVLLGIFKYVREEFFVQMGKDSQIAKDINALAVTYGELYQRQSDRDMPKTKFSQGIQKGKIMAKEFSGVMLLIATILQSSNGKDLLKSSRKKNFREDWQFDNWTMLIELLMQWEAFLKMDQMERKHVRRLKKKHRELMFLIKSVCRRKKGMGLKIMKFHQVLHIALDIMMFGVPMCVDTGSNESHHKLTKIAAKLTQKDIRFFEQQTAQRLLEFLILDLALEELNGRSVWDYFVGYDNPRQQKNVETVRTLSSDEENDSNLEGSLDSEAQEDETITFGTRIRVLWDEDEEEPGWCFHGTRMANPDKVSWNRNVQSFLWQVQEACAEWVTELEIRTEHKRKGQIFRGHPNYRQLGQWNDWVLIDWAEDGHQPGEIWCFIDLSEMPDDATFVLAGVSFGPGVYAVVESSDYEDATTQKSDVLTPIVKTCEAKDAAGHVETRWFNLADVEAFLEPICVVPDVGAEDSCRYFHVQPRKDWAMMFKQWLEEPYQDIS